MNKMIMDEIKDLSLENAVEVINNAIEMRKQAEQKPETVLAFLGRQDWMTDDDCTKYGIA
jgi:ATP-dependent protease ClpP protease subunit